MDSKNKNINNIIATIAENARVDSDIFLCKN